MAGRVREYRERIIRDPSILVGKPIVKGTRISVELILKHLADNPAISGLFAAYPRLTAEDVKAAWPMLRRCLLVKNLLRRRGSLRRWRTPLAYEIPA